MKTKSTVLPFVFAVLLPFASLAQTPAESPVAAAKRAAAQNDLVAAEKLLAPLVVGDAADAAACHELGAIRMRQNRFEEAIALYEQAAKLDAKNPEHFAALGMAIAQRMSQVPMMQQGMLAMSLKKAFGKAVELDPNHVTGLIGLARFYLNAPEIAGGSTSKARELAERVKRIVPVVGELELGNIAEQQEDFAGAAQHYEAAVKLAADNLHARVSAARALKRSGQTAAARAHLDAALALNPNYGPAKRALAEFAGGPGIEAK